MTAIVLLFVLLALVAVEVLWGVWMLFTGRTDRKPPRHVEHTWAADELPSQPYVAVR